MDAFSAALFETDQAESWRPSMVVRMTRKMKILVKWLRRVAVRLTASGLPSIELSLKRGLNRLEVSNRTMDPAMKFVPP